MPPAKNPYANPVPKDQNLLSQLINVGYIFEKEHYKNGKIFNRQDGILKSDPGQTLFT
jgi:hypothetical protein